MPLEYDGAFFPIDEDIISQANDGTFFKMESGLYPLNSSIGENGGFRIPLIVRQ